MTAFSVNCLQNSILQLPFKAPDSATIMGMTVKVLLLCINLQHLCLLIL